jgi:beta-galactosidase
MTKRMPNMWIPCLIAAAAVAVQGCEDREEVLAFPEGFLWGTSTAGFQVDMGCPSRDCDDRASDWYEWATHPSIIGAGLVSGDPPDGGPGHWELFDTDFALARDELSNNAFRMSIEWSRIFPESTEGVEGHESLRALADADALAHYHDVFASMERRGLEPLVTLNHYTLPLWIHGALECHVNYETCANRGWLDPERLIAEMVKYAGFAAREFGSEVDLWATLNEPLAVVLAGYVFPSETRTNPPGIVDPSMELGMEVFFSMIEAHARMYDAVQENDLEDADGDGRPAEVGLVNNFTPFVPLDPEKEEDVRGAGNASYLYNEVFLNAVTGGDLDRNLDRTLEEGEHRDDLAGRMDFIGINYYTRVHINGLFSSINPDYPTLDFLPESLWEFYPRGIYEMIMLTHGYGLPIYITENGVEDPLGDETGPGFLVPHLHEVWKAIEEGADVRGYFYWTFMDNFEWNHGFEIKMGMYAFDPATRERRAKRIAEVYGEIAAAGGISRSLLDRYAH